MSPANSKMPWDGVIPQGEKDAYQAAGFGRRSGVGTRPALLIIDVQYRTVGTVPRPFWEAVKEFSTSCGQVGWDAVGQIERVLTLFRAKGWPVVYPYVSEKQSFDQGRLADKVPALMTVEKRGYEFVKQIAPQPSDVLLPKKHPSAFFGTPLVSYLIERGIDTLIVTGCTTSGCVRGTVVDAFAYNFRAIVPHECVYDRGQTSHAVNLFDMGQKYADVMSTDEVLETLQAIGPAD